MRPHDALAGKTPAEVYKPTDRRKAIVRPFAYAAGVTVVRVQRGGLFSWCGSSYFVGVPLAGVHIGVETLDLLHVRAWLRDVDLGIIEIAPAVRDSAYEQPVRPKTRRNTTKAA